MLQPDDRRMITPQLAMRVAIFGGIAFVAFAAIFFRLWFLQVLSGDRYLAQANDNRVRDISISAPRGDIVDRNGKPLAESRVATVVQIEPNRLPESKDGRLELYRRLGRVIGLTPKQIQERIKESAVKEGPFANATIKIDVARPVFNYLLERQDRFPAVTVQRAYVRQYPHTVLGAQMIGTVGEVTEDELKREKFKGVKGGTIVGKGGVESIYDRYLRGVPGAARVQVDAAGRFKGQLATREPQQGKQLMLSIDLGMEKAGQEAMAQAAGIAITNGSQNRGGAYVAMNPLNGEVYAMGSFPTFDPNLFVRPLSNAKFKRLNSEENGSPMFDRVIQGLYPTGSTFKPITATAALESGKISPDTPVNDPGFMMVGKQRFQNAGSVANGTVALRDALKVSSDVYFYELGLAMNSLKPHGGPLQQWARRFGISRKTGIDLPGEESGLLPDPTWRKRIGAKEKACRKRKKSSWCGISDMRPWSVGDNINLSVGQGDIAVTPLQLAAAYSGLVNAYRNNGTAKVVTPHVGLQIQDNEGRTLQNVEPSPARTFKIDPTYVNAIMDGLHAAASAPGGTSYDVFTGFPYTVYGKTGTAERAGQLDQSWYVAYATDNGKRPIIVAVTVEQGGFGAAAAAPAARWILSQWFGVKKEVKRGSSHTR